MTKTNKISVGVIFGGKSGEHEVSLVSATSVINALDKDKYNLIQIGITKEGKWLTGADCLIDFKNGKYDSLDEILFSTNPSKKGIIVNNNFIQVDILFPVLHGPYGEDGTIQGLFEMLDIPYVGCGVLASSTGMDKIQCKAIWRSLGLNVVPAVVINRIHWEKDQDKILKDIDTNIGIPCFVKPANMGSSVGVSKVKSAHEMIGAINNALKYDRKILVEKAINAREIECAILGNDEAIALELGEVLVGGEFYDYNDKYVDEKSSTQVPAKISKEQREKALEMALKAYKALDASGLSRVDLFIDKDNGEIYLNELNTLPGFTSISMYPKMAEHAGIKYPDLVDKLIQLGVERYQDKQKLKIAFDSGSDWFKK